MLELLAVRGPCQRSEVAVPTSAPLITAHESAKPAPSVLVLTRATLKAGWLLRSLLRLVAFEPLLVIYPALRFPSAIYLLSVWFNSDTSCLSSLHLHLPETLLEKIGGAVNNLRHRHVRGSSGRRAEENNQVVAANSLALK